MNALGPLGDDDCARRLARFVRDWPGEAAHARAVAGLDVLAAIGTDVALMHLNGIALKVKFKGLQGKAAEKIQAIAETRGLTREELEDRLAPDLGLDDDGSMALDFGPRAFRVGFDEQLRPFAKDADGSRLKDLPKPKQSDDPEKAAAAAAKWSQLKKDAKTAASLQILRLELAMCGQRRFAPGDFLELFVRHPLVFHVVRRLIWATYDGKNRVAKTFRVAEDRSLADLEENAFQLPGDVKVGIPHPLELEQAVTGRWSQVLADYENRPAVPAAGPAHLRRHRRREEGPVARPSEGPEAPHREGSGTGAAAVAPRRSAGRRRGLLDGEAAARRPLRHAGPRARPLHRHAQRVAGADAGRGEDRHARRLVEHQGRDSAGDARPHRLQRAGGGPGTAALVAAADRPPT
ncbi:MAG: DUF4132 domain-containing protein [Myxococcales bacterium]